MLDWHHLIVHFQKFANGFQVGSNFGCKFGIQENICDGHLAKIRLMYDWVVSFEVQIIWVYLGVF